MKTIIITGSVGSGKTTLAKHLAKKTKYPIFDFKKFAKEKKLAVGYDKKRKCDIIDEKKFAKEIIKELNRLKKENKTKGIIIDSHMAQYIPAKYVDLCIVTKAPIETLKKRLKKRRYSELKIQENIECEIFDICLEEAKERGHRIFVIDIKKIKDISKLCKHIVS